MYALIASGRSPFAGLAVLKMLPLGLSIIAAVVWVGVAIVVFVFTVTPGIVGPNRYGPDPYGPGELEQVFA